MSTGEQAPARDLSIVMPVYNERNTIEEIVARVSALEGLREIVAVDDGSHDGTRDILARLEREVEPLRVVLHERNAGKGAALRTGIAEALGDIVVIQDADLEYDPADIPALVAPIRDGRSCSARASPAASRIASCTSGTPWATRSSPCSPTR